MYSSTLFTFVSLLSSFLVAAQLNCNQYPSYSGVAKSAVASYCSANYATATVTATVTASARATIAKRQNNISFVTQTSLVTITVPATTYPLGFVFPGLTLTATATTVSPITITGTTLPTLTLPTVTGTTVTGPSVTVIGGVTITLPSTGVTLPTITLPTTTSIPTTIPTLTTSTLSTSTTVANDVVSQVLNYINSLSPGYLTGFCACQIGAPRIRVTTTKTVTASATASASARVTFTL